MANQIFSPGSIPLEGTSQIFVNTPGNPGEGFKEIFVNQNSRTETSAATAGKKLPPSGKDNPVERRNEQSRTAQDDSWEPTFVTPPEKADQSSDDQPIVAADADFDGETYPVTDLFTADAGIEAYALTDADLAEPIAIEPVAVEATTTAVAQQPPGDEETTAGITELAALQAGQYAGPVAVDASQKAASRVEIAALNTRPYTQPLDTGLADDAAEIMPATSGVTATSLNAEQAQSNVVPATSSGVLQNAIRNVVKDEAASNLPAQANDEPETIPATSAATLSADRLAELRQIQAYAENATARANDGSNSTSNQSIDIAAMTARLDRSTATAAGQHAIHTAPQPLNVTEKGWEAAFGQNIQWMNANNIKSAQIRINPAELGPVKIDLSMNKDHLSLQINATHQITRDTLEAALPRLRSELADQGFSNANIDMADQGRDQQAGQHGADDESSFSGDAILPAEEDNDAAAIVPAASAANLMSGSVSLLDTFA